MARKNKKAAKKSSKKATKKTKKPSRMEKPHRQLSKAKETKKPPTPQKLEVEVPSPLESKQEPGFKIAIDIIDGRTIIGDLIVVFPRTREILKKHGLRLEVEEAGDIFMTLEAFAALQGLKTDALIGELVEASREPLLQPAQPQQIPQLAAPPTA